ncbi:hypothetical protein PHMEG_00030874 [Phytophthora megakarya]|uniref:Uncharacterized protein n=1 Tax=Phytophthora megakarya TaxID=4795 RepID=A0A225V0N6_9STRA|nr:hypothetical protein PHMEG_00030874 [Phytophthora megakarya]
MARTRRIPTTRQSVISDAVRNVDFKHLWRQLRAAGWTSKRPSGLSNEWSYSSPNGESFVGEDAVVRFALESGLSVNSSEAHQTEDSDEDAETDTMTAEEEGAEARSGDRDDANNVLLVNADDVNVVQNDNHSNGYESVDSSGSDTSDNSGDEIIVRREYPSDADEQDDVVAGMDETFIQSLGGSLALDVNALRQFSWSPPSSEFES